MIKLYRVRNKEATEPIHVNPEHIQAIETRGAPSNGVHVRSVVELSSGIRLSVTDTAERIINKIDLLSQHNQEKGLLFRWLS